MKPRNKKNITLAIFGLITALLISVGIFAVMQESQSGPANSSKVQIVAGTNVWGDIASQIGGDNVQVASVLTDPEVDPHLFEADAKTASQIASAKLVIVNGLDYDEFMTDLLKAVPSDGKTTLTVSEVLKVSADANPHLWYDLPRISEVAVAIQDELIKIDPSNADEYKANTQTFNNGMKPVLDRLAQINREHAGKGVAYTERVAEYLVEDAGLVDKTPTDFAAAVESGSEPSPQQVKTFTDLLAAGSVAALLYNNQAVNDMTEQILAAAQQSGVGVVGVAETVPAGKTFQAWQLDQLNALLEALNK